MKKRLLAMMLAASMAFTLGACGKSSASKETEESKESGDTGVLSTEEVIDKDVVSCVKLGDYKGLEVELTGDYSTDDKAVDAYIDSKITASYEKDDTQDTVKKDSIVNVDYQGKKDGVAFEGGTAEDVMIDVAGNSDAESGGGYIDGFTSGLVGAKVGTSIDCPCKFPDNYGSSELAGKEVVFTFKINYIAKSTSMDHSTLTDEYVKENYGVDTVEDYRKSAKAELEAQNDRDKDTEMRSAILSRVADNCKIEKLPDGLLDDRFEDYKMQFTSMYVDDGQSLEDYLKNTYDMTVEDFEEQSKSTLEQTLRREIIFLAIADAEGIEIDSDGFNEYLAQLVSSYGTSTREELYAKFARTAEAGKKYLHQVYLCNKAVDLCVDSAKVK